MDANHKLWTYPDVHVAGVEDVHRGVRQLVYTAVRAGAGAELSAFGDLDRARKHFAEQQILEALDIGFAVLVAQAVPSVLLGREVDSVSEHVPHSRCRGDEESHLQNTSDTAHGGTVPGEMLQFWHPCISAVGIQLLLFGQEEIEVCSVSSPQASGSYGVDGDSRPLKELDLFARESGITVTHGGWIEQLIVHRFLCHILHKTAQSCVQEPNPCQHPSGNRST